MREKVEMSYMLKLLDSFRKIPPGKCIEIEINRLGAANGDWEIPIEFRELFKDYSIRIEPVEIINRPQEERKFTFMMYNLGGEPGITFIY
jgi:hypothetical protein